MSSIAGHSRYAMRQSCEIYLASFAQYHGQPTVILIDEYDTPLHTAFARGYYDEAAGFFRGFLSGGLKDNQYLFKGVLTGILRIARESLFSGLNNFAVYSLLSHDFATDFGFTEPEVQDLVQRAGSDRTMDDLRRWYNGYSFGGQVIYNPWSVVNALMQSKDPLQPYWVNTASDDLIRELIFRVGGGESGELETLLQGQGVRKTLRQDIVLRDIQRDPDALWSFLLFTGYLKAEDVRVEEVGIGSRITGELKLPNREVASVFANLFAGLAAPGARRRAAGAGAFAGAAFGGPYALRATSIAALAGVGELPYCLGGSGEDASRACIPGLYPGPAGAAAAQVSGQEQPGSGPRPVRRDGDPQRARAARGGAGAKGKKEGGDAPAGPFERQGAAPIARLRGGATCPGGGAHPAGGGGFRW